MYHNMGNFTNTAARRDEAKIKELNEDASKIMKAVVSMFRAIATNEGEGRVESNNKARASLTLPRKLGTLLQARNNLEDNQKKYNILIEEHKKLTKAAKQEELEELGKELRAIPVVSVGNIKTFCDALNEIVEAAGGSLESLLTGKKDQGEGLSEILSKYRSDEAKVMRVDTTLDQHSEQSFKEQIGNFRDALMAIEEQFRSQALNKDNSASIR